MDLLEEVTEKVHDGYFVDLFVRVSNTSAITMYKKVSRNLHIQYVCLRSDASVWSVREDASLDCYLANMSTQSVLYTIRTSSPGTVWS